MKKEAKELVRIDSGTERVNKEPNKLLSIFQHIYSFAKCDEYFTK